MEIKPGQIWKNKTNNDKLCVVEDNRNISCINEYGKCVELSYYELIFNYRLYDEYRTAIEAYNNVKCN